MKFKLRHDLQSTPEGVLGGLPFQDTDWFTFDVPDWDAAKATARHLFSKHRTHDPRAAQYTQGMVLMEGTDDHAEKLVTNTPLRLVTFST